MRSMQGLTGFVYGFYKGFVFVGVGFSFTVSWAGCVAKQWS